MMKAQTITSLCATLLTLASSATAEERVQFNRDIRPILADTCWLCHGPDKTSRQAALRLDLRDEATVPAESGATPIVPGKPDSSEIIKRLFSSDPEKQMPPPEFQKKLTTKQKELLKRWVAEGAEYQPHWLYVPLARPEVPKVSDSGSIANGIDSFIVRALESKQIKPSPEADRRLLLRRLSLDLTGLPPTPSEVEAFVADTSPNAYEKQVDRLLQSPHFGERLAVWWLDVARFTDTVGFHGDQNQRIFPYRDYVIDSFNRNKPFDQFTLEQLAGDLLPNATNDQLVATGFNRLNMMTREGGAQPKEYLAKYGADRVRTIGTTWLGSTMGCAECHDHKYDPFTMRDFYSLQAFFADVKQWGVYSDYGYTPNPELKGWSNEHPFPPEITVESEYLLRRKARLEKQVDELLVRTAEKLKSNSIEQAKFEQWSTSLGDFLKRHPDGWSTPSVVAQPDNQPQGVSALRLVQPKNLELTAEGVVRFTSKPAKGEDVQIELLPDAKSIASVRLQLVPDAPGKGAIITSVPKQVVKLTASVKPAKGKARNAGFYFAEADHKESKFSNTNESIGVTDGWTTSGKATESVQTSVWKFNPPILLNDGDTLSLTVNLTASVPVRVAVSPLAVDASSLSFHPSAAALVDAAKQGTLDDGTKAVEQYLIATAWDSGAFAEYLKLHRSLTECRNGQAATMVTAAMQPLTVRILPRGNFLDESGPIVQPALPAFLSRSASGSATTADDKRLSRLDLARWLCSKENPVTPRNIMNRLWKQFFGNAISNVVDDLGAQGEPPSHPELLDWLAIEFRDSGWNLKHTLKLVVMSKTYRQDSRYRPELLSIDPNNRLLAFQNPRRLDAEFVRDNALAIAGLLNAELGGPSVKPYQPPGYYVNLQFPSRDYIADIDERQWRRGVYMHWQRTFLHPMLANFDAPAREECTANRVVSNTPQQALTLLNDLTFVEAARVFSSRLLQTNAKDDEQRLNQAFGLAVARPAKARERESLLKFLAAQREHFQANPTEADKLTKLGIATVPEQDRIEWAAWLSVCRVILNLQETMTRY